MSIRLPHRPAAARVPEGQCMHARLEPTDGGPPIELTKDLTLVGRGDDCDVKLDHKSVSKLHCIIVKGDGLLLIRDLGSTNGTRVNGQRVRRAAILPNDSLQVANVKFQVKVGANPLPGADPAAARPDAPPPMRVNVHPDFYPEQHTPPG